MRARLDISEVESATKIRAKYLRAIENEDWALLPGPTFVRTFLRTYAEHLGLDAKLLVDEYRQRHEPPPEQEPHPIGPSLGPRRPPRLPAPRLSRGWAIGLSVLGVFVLLIVLGSLGKEPSSPSLPTPTQPSHRPKARRAAPPRPTRVALQLIPNGEVYVCLRNAADQLVLSDTLQAGSPSRTYRSKRFHLTLGNNSVSLKVNGRILDVPASANAISYELTPRGRKRLPDDENACNASSSSSGGQATTSTTSTTG